MPHFHINPCTHTSFIFVSGRFVDNGEVQAAAVGFEMEDEIVDNDHNERNEEEFDATAF